jgi:hypothetical protein
MTHKRIKRHTFDPFIQANPPPGAAVTDGPLLCVALNQEWAAWLRGAAVTLTMEEIYEGDTATKEWSVNQAKELLLLLSLGECNMITDIRIDGCDLQVMFDSGQWVTIGNLSACATGEQGPPGPPGADGITPAPVWDETSLSWDLDNDGVGDTAYVDLQGPQGAAGVDGECPPDCGGPVDYPSEPPPYPPGQEPPDIRCSAATKTATVLMDSIVEIEGKVNQALGFTEFLFLVTTIGVQAFFGGAIVNAYRNIWDLVKGGDTFDAQVIRDGVMCEAYCILGEDGLWDRDKVLALADALEQRAVDEPDARYAAVGLFVRMLDHNGINYSERVDPIPGADCSGCDCGGGPGNLPITVGFDPTDSYWPDFTAQQAEYQGYTFPLPTEINYNDGYTGPNALYQGQTLGSYFAGQVRVDNIGPGDINEIEFSCRWNNGTAGYEVHLDFYDSSDQLITSLTQAVQGNSNSWRRYTATVSAPGTAYVVVMWRGNRQGVSFGAMFDSLVLKS